MSNVNHVPGLSNLANGPVTHETRIACLALPADCSPLYNADDPFAIGFVDEEGRGRSLIGCSAVDVRCVPILHLGRILEWVCRYRAPRTVPGLLHCDGKPLSPEAYLRRWREALTSPVPIVQALTRLGVLPMGRFRWTALDADRGMTAGWTHAPYPTFGDLLDALGPRLSVIQRGDQQTAIAVVDMTTADGPRLTWWLNDFLSARRFGERVACRFVSVDDALPGGAAATAYVGKPPRLPGDSQAQFGACAALAVSRIFAFNPSAQGVQP